MTCLTNAISIMMIYKVDHQLKYLVGQKRRLQVCLFKVVPQCDAICCYAQVMFTMESSSTRNVVQALQLNEIKGGLLKYGPQIHPSPQLPHTVALVPAHTRLT